MRGGKKCGFALDWWAGRVGIVAFHKCRLIPPHPSPAAPPSPSKGKASLHCANMADVVNMADMANIILCCGLPLRFALVALSCSAKGILQKGFPLGWEKTASSLSRKRLMRGDKSAFPIEMYRSALSSTNFLPFLSGSGESENVRISLAECGSEQPEFGIRLHQNLHHVKTEPKIQLG